MMQMLTFEKSFTEEFTIFSTGVKLAAFAPTLAFLTSFTRRFG
jgi:hypothetical protein